MLPHHCLFAAELVARLGVELLALRAAEQLDRRRIHLSAQGEAEDCLHLLDTLRQRSQTASHLKALRTRTLRDRAVAIRAQKKQNPGGASACVRRVVALAGQSGRGGGLLSALSATPPKLTPNSITTRRDFDAAQRQIEQYSSRRTKGLRELQTSPGLCANADAEPAAEIVANEMYVTVATELELRACLLLQPFNGRVGAAAVQRRLIGHVCRGCRQQRAALAAGHSALSGFDPMRYLGTGFDCLPDVPEHFVCVTLATSSPFLTMSPTCDLLAQVINFAHVCGLGARPDVEADPAVTANPELAREALSFMVRMSSAVSEINAQLGVFLVRKNYGPAAASGAQRPTAMHQAASQAISTVTLRVPVGWPRPLVDPIERPEYLWVVPRDRLWTVANGWHSGTGLPPTLDISGGVVPETGGVMPSVALLQRIRDDYIHAVVNSPRLQPALRALVEAETNAAQKRRQVAWFLGLDLATAEAAGVDPSVQ